MKKITGYLLFIIVGLFICITSVYAVQTTEIQQEQIDDIVSLEGKTVMIVGNSMVYYGNCVISGNAGEEDYGYFYQLAASNGENVTVIDQTYGGKKLDYIYENYLVNLTEEERNEVDYVVLCEAKQENNNLLLTCQNIMSLFPETTQLRFMCHPMIYDANVSSVISGMEALRENNIEIVDWGKMVYDIYMGELEVPGATLEYTRSTFTKDNTGFVNGTGYGVIASGKNGDRKHPNLLSGYISALALYSSLTNRSAVGADYSFCDNSEIHSFFNIDGFVLTHYTGEVDTNFDEVFRSEADMLGLQTLIDICRIEEGKHPLIAEEGVEATCTEDGFTRWHYCSYCGAVAKEKEIIPATGHSELILEGITPDCVNPGITEGKICEVCNQILLEQEELPASGHTEVVIEEVPPRCTKEGFSAGAECSVCGEVLIEPQRIEATGHKDEDENGKCDYCDFVFEVKETDPSVSVTVPEEKTTVSSSRNDEATTATDKNVATEPEKPENLQIVSTKTSSVTLSWSAQADGEAYIVYYSSDCKNWKSLKIGTNKATVKKLKSGKKYYFKVKTIEDGKESEESETLISATKPSKAALKKVEVDGRNKATVAWKKVAGANGYELMYSTKKSFSKRSTKKLIFKKAGKKKATLKGLKSGRKYFVKIRAYKNINSKKLYGAYSKIKTVIIK